MWRPPETVGMRVASGRLLSSQAEIRFSWLEPEAGGVGCGGVRTEDEEGLLQRWGGASAILQLWACAESWAHLQNPTAWAKFNSNFGSTFSILAQSLRPESLSTKHLGARHPGKALLLFFSTPLQPPIILWCRYNWVPN